MTVTQSIIRWINDLIVSELTDFQAVGVWNPRGIEDLIIVRLEGSQPYLFSGGWTELGEFEFEIEVISEHLSKADPAGNALRRELLKIENLIINGTNHRLIKVTEMRTENDTIRTQDGKQNTMHIYRINVSMIIGIN